MLRLNQLEFRAILAHIANLAWYSLKYIKDRGSVALPARALSRYRRTTERNAGAGGITIETIIAEVGADMSPFPTAAPCFLRRIASARLDESVSKRCLTRKNGARG
jgi:hypothetical protein